MLNPDFITVDFQLPVHANELSKAEEVLEKLKNKFETHQKSKTLNANSHTQMYEEVVRVLDYVGHLSIPAFEIEERLKAMYDMQYLHAPELAKKLWMDHYEHIHHPYSLLKNRCFRLLEDLDNLYIAMYKKNPPNWNI
jgi:hypothetical protein